MKKVAIEWTDDSYDVVITVREATRADGLHRASLRVTQYDKYIEDKADEINEENFQLRWWRIWQYPAIMATTEGWENRDPEKEQLPDILTEDILLGLPDGLLVVWEAAVLKLNPSFFPFAEEDGRDDREWLDQRLIEFYSPPRIEDDPEEKPGSHWTLVRREESFRWWRFLESTRSGMTGQYSFLPYAGGWADQPEWLIHDITLISEYAWMLREQMKTVNPSR